MEKGSQAERRQHVNIDHRISEAFGHAPLNVDEIVADDAIDDSSSSYAANKYFALSFENALRRSLNTTLALFMPTVVPVGLRDNEVLEFVDAVGAEVRDGQAKRIAVGVSEENGVMTRRRLIERPAHPSGGLIRLALHKSQDQGSIGWVASCWMDSRLFLRSTTVEDEAHRYHGNDLKNAMVRCGLWIVICERTHLYNARTAPWQGHGFRNLIADAAELYFKHRDCHCPLFSSLYDRLCDELGVPLVGRGTAMSVQSVFEQIQQCPLFTKKGSRVRLGRWGSWHEASESWFGHKYSCLLVLTFMALMKKWEDVISHLPVFNVPALDVEIEGEEMGNATVADMSIAASSSSAGVRGYRWEIDK